jgi:hypothetical protein
MCGPEKECEVAIETISFLEDKEISESIVFFRGAESNFIV